MNNALNLIYWIYNKCIDFIFNQMTIVTGVSFGWVLIVCFVFMVLIKSILNLPVNGVFTRQSTRDIQYKRSLKYRKDGKD